MVPDGPEEVAESGRAFNQLVERLAELLAAERERVADLSHRLRTPIAALRLQADSVVDPVAREGLISDIVHLEGEVTALIEDVRRTGSDESTQGNTSPKRKRPPGPWTGGPTPFLTLDQVNFH